MANAATGFSALIETITQAVCAGAGPKAAACFTEHGVYRDGFYGEFKGRAAIADLVQNRFHREAKELRNSRSVSSTFAPMHSVATPSTAFATPRSSTAAKEFA
jgi:hypothetical protein